MVRATARAIVRSGVANSTLKAMSGLRAPTATAPARPERARAEVGCAGGVGRDGGLQGLVLAAADVSQHVRPAAARPRRRDRRAAPARFPDERRAPGLARRRRSLARRRAGRTGRRPRRQCADARRGGRAGRCARRPREQPVNAASPTAPGVPTKVSTVRWSASEWVSRAGTPPRRCARRPAARQ